MPYEEHLNEIIIPTLFKKSEGDILITSVRLFIRLSVHTQEWTLVGYFKIQIFLYEVKRSNIIKFRLPCQFQRFLYQTVCVFSQIKDRKHIEYNFHSVAGVMPQGRDLGVLGGQKL